MRAALLAAVLCAAAISLAVFGVRFHRRQARGALGGAISRAKAYWLCFAVFFWFVVCPVVALDDVLAPVLTSVLLAFSLSMWARGMVEMFLLYVTKSWRPPMGIGHDLFCVALIGVMLAMRHGEVRAALVSGREIDLWGVGLIAAVLTSLCVEVHHARGFFRAVQGQTTGDAGVWFADDAQERFRRINRTTLVWNIALTLWVGAFLVRYSAARLGGAL